MNKLMRKILVVPLLVLIMILPGCQTVTASGEVPPAVVNTVSLGVSLYCEVFHNVHRNLMRVVRVADPGWVSICEQYFAMKTEADPDGSESGSL